jgi:predicted dehydrogenase
MSDGVSRRHFFYGALLTGAVPAAGFGSVPSLRALGYKPFYDKLNVASIGCGGQGGGDLNSAARTENIVALCEVDEDRAAASLKRYPGVPRYKDFRVMLDKEGKNIDACTIGIPDHMHATVALACMQRGKHVYVEKPLTRTPWEARLLMDAAVKYKVATQMGNQGFSHEAIRVTSEMVWSGAIGDVKEVHVSCAPGTHPTGARELPKEDPVPKSLDWDLWLGGAAARPFSSQYVPYNWRAFFDFGTGQIGNWGIHTMGPVHLALQLGAPISVERVSIENQSQYTFPNRAVIRFEFPARGEMPPVTIYWHDSARPGDPEAYRVPGMENEIILPRSNNLAERTRPAGGRGPMPAGPPPITQPNVAPGAPPARPPRAPGGAPATRTSPGGPGVSVFAPPGGWGTGARPGVLTGNGAVMVGSKGILATCDRGEGVHLLPAERWKDYELPPQLLTRSPGHMLDWIRACKGGDPSCSDFSVTAPFVEWMTLGVIAFRVPGKLEWDSQNQRFANSAEANKYVKPLFRKGWELKL